jgi:hypothetical protein
MTDISKMTDEEFDEGLQHIINEECCAADLLRIPGIYEILSEHFNNEILTRWEEKMDTAFFNLTGKYL